MLTVLGFGFADLILFSSLDSEFVTLACGFEAWYMVDFRNFDCSSVLFVVILCFVF